MKYLIVNADDYGRTPSGSRGIRETHTNGIVTSTTCMLNFPASAADIRTARSETPALGLGVCAAIDTYNIQTKPFELPAA